MVILESTSGQALDYQPAKEPKRQEIADYQQQQQKLGVCQRLDLLTEETQRCNADEAFALLRAHSQNNNRKLRDVAADLITRVTGGPPLPGRGFHRGRPPAG